MNPSPADDPTIVDSAATMPAGAELEVTVEYGGVPHTSTVRSAVLTMGSDADCTIRVPAEGVSRRHARLTVIDAEWLLEDMGSSNGTLVAGRAVTQPVRLWPGQRFQIGAATVQVRRARGTVPGSSTAMRFLPEEKRQSRRYDIASLVAQGGMGAVLDARDGAMERKVAMKVMLDPGDPEALARFIAEARITGQLEHPNIVPIHDIGVDENGHAFYTMKFVRGVTLADVFHGLVTGDAATVEKYPLPVLLTVFQKVCDALAFAHSRGVIHRDLKPANIMLGDYGEVLVMDWGLAKLVDSTPSAAAPASALHSSIIRPGLPQEGHSFGSTLTGSIMGTPQYMAPEQARGEIESLDARTDLYSLGAILFELLHLRPPFSDGAAMEIVRRVSRGEVEWSAPKSTPAAPRREIPASLLAVCRKALALHPGDRYPRVAALQADLTAWQNGFATRAENAGAWTQIRLLIRRHKTAALGTAAVLTVGAVLGGKVLIEGRRSEKEANRANAALADLRRSAPVMLALAENEADLQRFDSALEKIDAAIALDSTLSRAYWRRATILLAKMDYKTSMAAFREAQAIDPQNVLFRDVIALVSKLAGETSGGIPTKDLRDICDRLSSAGAYGESSRFVSLLSLTNEEGKKFVETRVSQWLGMIPGSSKKNFHIWIENNQLRVVITNTRLGTLEPLKGLPIAWLEINECGIKSLEPLKGMPLLGLVADGNPIEDLSPLKGMPLEHLSINRTLVKNLGPVKGLPLKFLQIYPADQIADLSALSSAPLRELHLFKCAAIDYSPLRGRPIERLYLTQSRFLDASVLSGMPLAILQADGTRLTDLKPLIGLPLKRLNFFLCKVADYSPLLELPGLESVVVNADRKAVAVIRDHPGLREIKFGDSDFQSTEKFWANFDAQLK